MPAVSPRASDCHSIVVHLVNRHDWRLLDVVEFSRQLAIRAQSINPADQENLTKVAVNLYCEVWYAACSSTGDHRHRAYTELARYLYDYALHKYRNPDLAHEITHDAIILISEQLANCRNPGTFLAFALLKLWNAATANFRRRDRDVTQVTELVVDDGEEGGREPAAQTLTPEATVLHEEAETTLVTRLNELLREAPRAEKQIKAVLLKFLYSYNDEAIAVALTTDVANVHVLRSRGLKRLRSDPVLRQLAKEWG